jgi:hypothetical protein
MPKTLPWTSSDTYSTMQHYPTLLPDYHRCIHILQMHWLLSGTTLVRDNSSLEWTMCWDGRNWLKLLSWMPRLLCSTVFWDSSTIRLIVVLVRICYHWVARLVGNITDIDLRNGDLLECRGVLKLVHVISGIWWLGIGLFLWSFLRGGHPYILRTFRVFSRARLLSLSCLFTYTCEPVFLWVSGVLDKQWSEGILHLFLFCHCSYF